MDFKELYEIDVTKHIEKKGRFNYLSWVYAVKEFRKAFPEGTWIVKHFGENEQPFCQTDAGAFVEVTVYPNPDTIGFTQVHPVLNHQNKTIETPNAFDINTSIQRCLAKAIALTGIGLHIYAGEDTAQYDEAPPEEPKKTSADIEPYLDQQKPLTVLIAYWDKNAKRWEKLLEKPEWNKLEAFYAQLVQVRREQEESDAINAG